MGPHPTVPPTPDQTNQFLFLPPPLNIDISPKITVILGGVYPEDGEMDELKHEANDINTKRDSQVDLLIKKVLAV